MKKKKNFSLFLVYLVRTGLVFEDGIALAKPLEISGRLCSLCNHLLAELIKAGLQIGILSAKCRVLGRVLIPIGGRTTWLLARRKILSLNGPIQLGVAELFLHTSQCLGVGPLAVRESSLSVGLGLLCAPLCLGKLLLQSLPVCGPLLPFPLKLLLFGLVLLGLGGEIFVGAECVVQLPFQLLPFRGPSLDVALGATPDLVQLAHEVCSAMLCVVQLALHPRHLVGVTPPVLGKQLGQSLDLGQLRVGHDRHQRDRLLLLCLRRWCRVLELGRGRSQGSRCCRRS